MNIDTENLRSQLNSCSRTQDEVAKESITKGNFWISHEGGGSQSDIQCVKSIVRALQRVCGKYGTIREIWSVKGKSLLRKNTQCLHFELASK